MVGTTTPLQLFMTDLFQLYFILMIVMYLATLPGMWLTFEKAGKPGWGAIIPFYNAYLFFEIGDREGWKVLSLLIPLLNIIMILTVAVTVAENFGKGIVYGLGLVFAPPIFFALLGFGSPRYRGNASPA